MSTVAQVGEIFSAAGTAFSKLAELTTLLQVDESAPTIQGFVVDSVFLSFALSSCLFVSQFIDSV